MDHIRFKFNNTPGKHTKSLIINSTYKYNSVRHRMTI